MKLGNIKNDSLIIYLRLYFNHMLSVYYILCIGKFKLYKMIFKYVLLKEKMYESRPTVGCSVNSFVHCAADICSGLPQPPF